MTTDFFVCIGRGNGEYLFPQACIFVVSLYTTFHLMSLCHLRVGGGGAGWVSIRDSVMTAREF